MKAFALAMMSTALTAFCWGIYGPLMRKGTAGMEGSHLLPFIGVGVAYFLIAVLAPIAVLATKGEKGKWTAAGTFWSLVAGTITSVGALGIILAMTNGGSPLFVMPLVFGGAPVVNTFVTMYMTRSYKEAGPLFYAGLILVVVGATTVLAFNPAAAKPAAKPAAAVSDASASATAEKTADKPAAKTAETGTDRNLFAVLVFVALTALCWGGYGPLLHKGQMAMQGSRLRPFLCVGIAYFVVAVIFPLALRLLGHDHGEVTWEGSAWSLGAGAAGAIGSLGIILAFTFGGKPVYVMPLVFGGAPVLNTLVSIAMVGRDKLGEIHEFFYAGLIVVVAGAATVLIFAPKPQGKPAPKPEKTPAKSSPKQHA
jgi:hypothetical protein